MSTNEKYRVTDNMKTMEDGSELHQIESLIDIPSLNVEAGELGGFIESEDNLSFEDGDMSWVRNGCAAYGESEVKNDSVISRRSEVKNSIIDNSIIHKETMVNDSKVMFSNISHGSVINDSVVEDSRLAGDTINNSRIEVVESNMSNIDNSKLIQVEGSATVKDSEIENSVISERSGVVYDGVKMFDNTNIDIELTDEDLADLSELDNDIKL